MGYTAITMNLINLRPAQKGMYFVSGLWSEQCIAEARRHLPKNKLIEVTNLKGSDYTQMTDPKTWKIDKDASFFHICVNETVHGFDVDATGNFPWHLIPKDVAIVGDMTSCIGTRPIDWKRFDVVYAGVQKNMGPTGCTIYIVNKKLLGKGMAPDCPVICDW